MTKTSTGLNKYTPPCMHSKVAEVCSWPLTSI